LLFTNTIKKLLLDSRPAHARDFAPASVQTGIVSPDPTNSNIDLNPNNIDVSELTNRVQNLYSLFTYYLDINSSVLQTANANASNLRNESSVNHLRDVLKEVSDLGF